MESNVLRWNFQITTPNDPNGLTIFIEGRSLSIFLGYRVANDVHLFYKDFISFFKCLLMTRYIGVVYKDTHMCTSGLLLHENLHSLTFGSDVPYSPFVCIHKNKPYYLKKSTSKAYGEPNEPTPIKYPTFIEFRNKLDINEVLTFIKQYLRQSNIQIFGQLIATIINEWAMAYKERDIRYSPLNFFREISPSSGDFFLFHSLVDYVHSLDHIE